ncbi:hypothetical protein [Escherichia coli]|uniref:hypothetical protein n=1 Tax=Escherichia coli TaxID=562 RepID=UPI0031F50563
MFSGILQKTGKPVIVNPDIKGNVTVFNADVNPTNIDDFFKSVLNANGFVMLSGNPAVVSLPSKLPSQMVSVPMILITSLMILSF